MARMGSFDEELAFAIEAAEAGSKVALSVFGGDLERRRKSDGTWVTEADEATEAEIRRLIAARWPDHNILGEEEGETGAAGGPPTPGAPTWIVDPIDGTHNYMAGIQLWATLVGLRIDDRNVVGAVAAPALAESYDGALGSGARLNGRALRVSDAASLEGASFAYADRAGFRERGLDDFFEALTQAVWRTRGFGDFWGHMLVARGAVDAMIEADLNMWDVAALEPIVVEAGGRFSHVDGGEWNERGTCLSAPPAVHDEIVRLLHTTAPGWSERG